MLMTDWHDSWVFCKGLGPQYGLPSAIQQEVAIRGGSDKRYCYGDAATELGEFAWYDTNSGDHAHAVGLKRPNAYGVFDGHGQVWEWSWEWGIVGSSRVLRGGSCSCRSARRHDFEPGYRNSFLGFRVVLCLSVESSQSSS